MILQFTGISLEGKPIGFILDTSKKIYSDGEWVPFSKTKDQPRFTATKAGITCIKQACRDDGYTFVRTKEMFYK